MAQNTTDNNRRLHLEEQPGSLPQVKGWLVTSGSDENLGTAQTYLQDTKDGKARYLEIQNKQSENISVPLGLVSLQRDAQKVVLQNLDENTLNSLPSHAPGTVPSYREELKLRARLEEPDQVYSKLGKERKQPQSPPQDTTGRAINKEITDPEDAYKRDKDLNEGRVSDSMQGRYTPNLRGDEEGVKKPAINAEGKHDIPATSGHSGSTSKGSAAQESTGAPAPDENELPTTDKPGATLGNAEVENRYRDPENQTLPRGQGNPELPENAPDDFYRHPMFDSSAVK